MFFVLSKTLAVVLEPSIVLTSALLAGCLLLYLRRQSPWGRRLVVAGSLGVAGFGFLPVGTWLLVPLEDRFARADLAAGPPPTGIIVLGGAEQARISQGRGVVTLNDAGERLLEGAVLARRFPHARIVFTGGSSEVLSPRYYGADAAARFFAEQGLDPARVTLEGRSRNTHENAVFTRDLLAPKPGERWLLITSAYHMPRSIGCYRKAGFPVEPWPVDYRTAGAGDRRMLHTKPLDGLERLDMALREWIGLIVYRLTGKTDALLPVPAAAPAPATRPAS